MNGDNFRTGINAGAWLCGWTALLSSMANIASDDPLLTSDFGTPVNGCEAPWSKAQFTFVYNADAVAEPPKTMPQLLEWVREHPGRFTYPAPPDFTGSAFVRQLLYSVSGGYREVPAAFTPEAFQRLSPRLYDTARRGSPDERA